MTMTRKDFEIIAEIVSLYQSKDHGGERESAINAILRKTNPNYNSARFWRAVEKHAEA